MGRRVVGMRIGELAQRSGVAIPTIKYYLRVGLLAAGTATAPNQAIYDDSHLRTLRLVRALTGIGGLSVEATRTVLAAARDPRVPPAELVATIDRVSMTKLNDRFDPRARDSAEQLVASVVDARGWRVRQDARALARLIDICAAAELLEVDEIRPALLRYAEAADQFAASDTAATAGIGERMAPEGDRDETTLREALLVATVLGGALQAALRNLALENAIAAKGTPPGGIAVGAAEAE